MYSSYMSWDIFCKYNHSCCRLVSVGVPPHHFSYVFVDECGQVTEPEALIPVARILTDTKKKKTGQLTLTGDPKQLGPVIKSHLAAEMGLGKINLFLCNSCYILWNILVFTLFLWMFYILFVSFWRLLNCCISNAKVGGGQPDCFKGKYTKTGDKDIKERDFEDKLCNNQGRCRLKIKNIGECELNCDVIILMIFFQFKLYCIQPNYNCSVISSLFIFVV